MTVPDEDKDLEQVHEEILRNLDIFKLLKFLFSCRRLVLPHRVEVFFNLRIHQVIDQKLVIAWSRLLGRRDVARTNLILRPLYQFPRKMPWGRGCARIEARRIIRRAWSWKIKGRDNRVPPALAFSIRCWNMLAKGLGLAQTSNFSWDEPNSNLDRPKLSVDRLLVKTRRTNKLNQT